MEAVIVKTFYQRIFQNPSYTTLTQKTEKYTVVRLSIYLKTYVIIHLIGLKEKELFG